MNMLGRLQVDLLFQTPRLAGEGSLVLGIEKLNVGLSGSYGLVKEQYIFIKRVKRKAITESSLHPPSGLTFYK